MSAIVLVGSLYYPPPISTSQHYEEKHLVIMFLNVLTKKLHTAALLKQGCDMQIAQGL